jgi:plastocyanin
MKLWYGVGLVLLLGVAYVVFGRGNLAKVEEVAPSMTPVSQPSEMGEPVTTEAGEIEGKIVVVKFTDAGYEPARIVVPAGTTVRFVNESSMAMWTASDPHPDHTDHASFDSQDSVRRGGVYEYTFVEAGIYGYHNHSEDEFAGVVVVE